jgi:hypothetical protein
VLHAFFRRVYNTFGQIHLHWVNFYTLVTVFLVAIIFNLFEKKNNHKDKDEVIRLIIQQFPKGVKIF